MGIMVFSILWVVQDLYHQPYYRVLLKNPGKGFSFPEVWLLRL